jgi:endonuclease/exonuclease/phosphatase (EEP) superfamily protein YafD
MQIRFRRPRRLAFALSCPIAIALAGLPGCAERGTAPPIIENVPPPHAAPHASPDRDGVLRVATANLWGVVALGFDWADHIDERFAAFARRIGRNRPGIDVVLIQEAWKDRARRALLEDAAVERQFPYRVDSVDAPGGAGLVILSRFPIEEAVFRRFQDQGSCLKFWEGDCLAGKGILMVRVNVAGRSSWIGTTHLIACYPPEGAPETACDEEDPNGASRWSQIHQVRRDFDSRIGDDPALLGGDFNFTRSSRYYPVMARDPGWSEPGEQPPALDGIDYLWTRRGTIWRWRARGGVQPIFTEPVRLPNGETVPLSDHPILLGEFCLVRIGDPRSGCVSPSAP